MDVNQSQDQAETEKPEALSPEELAKRAAVTEKMMASLGGIVSVLMRSNHFKHYSFADIEWLVAPALITGQFTLANAQSKVNGLSVPVAVLLWADVSEEVDRRLTETKGLPLRLKPQEWVSGKTSPNGAGEAASGSVVWVVAGEGEPRVVATMIRQLKEKVYPDRLVRVVTVDGDGRQVVREI